MKTFERLVQYCKGTDTNKMNTWQSDTRANMCAKVFPTFPRVFRDFHRAKYVTQINGVPEGSVCAVTGGTLKGGVQLKFNQRHICLHSSYYKVWYHYFRIRHFPLYVLHLDIDAITAEHKWKQSVSVLHKYIADQSFS